MIAETVGTLWLDLICMHCIFVCVWDGARLYQKFLYRSIVLYANPSVHETTISDFTETLAHSNETGVPYQRELRQAVAAPLPQAWECHMQPAYEYPPDHDLLAVTKLEEERRPP